MGRSTPLYLLHMAIKKSWISDYSHPHITHNEGDTLKMPSKRSLLNQNFCQKNWQTASSAVWWTSEMNSFVPSLRHLYLCLFPRQTLEPVFLTTAVWDTAGMLTVSSLSPVPLSGYAPGTLKSTWACRCPTCTVHSSRVTGVLTDMACWKWAKNTLVSVVHFCLNHSCCFFKTPTSATRNQAPDLGRQRILHSCPLPLELSPQTHPWLC